MPETSIADYSRSLAVQKQEEFSVERSIEKVSRTTMWSAFTGVLVADVWITWVLAMYAPWLLVPALATLGISTVAFFALLKRGPGSEASKAIQKRLEAAKNGQPPAPPTDYEERYG